MADKGEWKQRDFVQPPQSRDGIALDEEAGLGMQIRREDSADGWM